MNTTKTLFLFIVAFSSLYFALPSAQAQADVRFVNEFLNIGVGARAHGMYGSVAATVDDISAAYWNPAGLANVEAPAQISAMHASWFGGISNYDYLAAGKRFSDKNNSYAAISLIRMGIDNIPNTLNLIGPDGTVDYDNVTDFSAVDYALMLSYGQDLGVDGLSIGGTGKVIYRRIGSFGSAVGFGFDMGLMYDMGNLKLGLMGRDITTTVNSWSFSLTPAEQAVFQDTENVIPVSSTEIALPKLVLAAAYEIETRGLFSYLVEGDIRFSSDGTRSGVFSGENIGIDPTIGLEIGYNKLAFFRMGVGNFQNIINETANTSFEFQPNIGIGLNLGNLHIDYALTNIGGTASALISHIFSLKLDLRGDRL